MRCGFFSRCFRIIYLRFLTCSVFFFFFFPSHQQRLSLDFDSLSYNATFFQGASSSLVTAVENIALTLASSQVAGETFTTVQSSYTQLSAGASLTSAVKTAGASYTSPSPSVLSTAARNLTAGIVLSPQVSRAFFRLSFMCLLNSFLVGRRRLSPFHRHRSIRQAPPSTANYWSSLCRGRSRRIVGLSHAIPLRWFIAQQTALVIRVSRVLSRALSWWPQAHLVTSRLVCL